MAKVTRTSSVTIGGRTYPVKRLDSLTSVLPDATIEATTTQLRVVAEESREILLDKLFAGRARRPGRRVAKRPARLRRGDIPTEARRPFAHKPLADSTIKRKAATGKDGRPLIETAEYAEGIKVVRGERKGQAFYSVRPKAGKHKSSGLTHRQIARIHEFGTSEVPPRPHWGPATRVVIKRFEELGPQVSAEVLRAAARRLR